MTNYKSINDWRIKINGMEHGIPHVHVEFRDRSQVVVAIENRTILAGGVSPSKRIIPAIADIKNNKVTYLNEYQRLNP